MTTPPRDPVHLTFGADIGLALHPAVCAGALVALVVEDGAVGTEFLLGGGAARAAAAVRAALLVAGAVVVQGAGDVAAGAPQLRCRTRARLGHVCGREVARSWIRSGEESSYAWFGFYFVLDGNMGNEC